MKTIIGILAFLFISVGASAQYFIKSTGFTERKELWKEQRTVFWEKDMTQEERMEYSKSCSQSAESYEEQIIDYGFYYTHKGVEYIRINAVHFIANGRVFMLSYEPKAERTSAVKTTAHEPECIDAEIYLYSKDMSDVMSPWEIASVEYNQISREYNPSNILVSSWKNSRNYNEIDFKLFDEEYANTSIGKVIELDNGGVEITVASLNRVNGVYDGKPLTFVFTPVDDKHYTFKRK